PRAESPTKSSRCRSSTTAARGRATVRRPASDFGGLARARCRWVAHSPPPDASSVASQRLADRVPTGGELLPPTGASRTAYAHRPLERGSSRLSGAVPAPRRRTARTPRRIGRPGFVRPAHVRIAEAKTPSRRELAVPVARSRGTAPARRGRPRRRTALPAQATALRP